MTSVLIVDDELSIVTFLKEVLDFYGFELKDVALNGEEAVQKYKDSNPKPDIILMDHRMPIKTGLDAAKEILEYDPEANVIFTSADDYIKEKALSLGALTFKTKPFTIEKLIRNINKILKSKI